MSFRFFLPLRRLRFLPRFIVILCLWLEFVWVGALFRSIVSLRVRNIRSLTSHQIRIHDATLFHIIPCALTRNMQHVTCQTEYYLMHMRGISCNANDACAKRNQKTERVSVVKKNGFTRAWYHCRKLSYVLQSNLYHVIIVVIMLSFTFMQSIPTTALWNTWKCWALPTHRIHSTPYRPVSFWTWLWICVCEGLSMHVQVTKMEFRK